MSIHEELLPAEGMRRAFDALQNQFRFLIHRTPICNLEAIRIQGLRTSRQDAANDADLTVVQKIIGDDYRNILCFKCSVSHLIVQNNGLDRVTLGCPTSALSGRIGVDWSSYPCWSTAEKLRGTNQSRACEDILLEVVQRYGSLVTYDGVPADSLRIRLKCSLQDPSLWPLLADSINTSHFYLKGI